MLLQMPMLKRIVLHLSIIIPKMNLNKGQYASFLNNNVDNTLQLIDWVNCWLGYIHLQIEMNTWNEMKLDLGSKAITY